jgi:hypothetical protein
MLTTRWSVQAPGDDWPRRHRLRRSALESAWAEFLGRVPWEFFVSLTFDPKKRFPANHGLASREAFWWCNQTSRVLRQPLAWVYAPERGESGQWHSHALLVGVSRAQLRVPAAMWKTRNGWIDVRPVWDLRGATLYTTKSAASSGEIVWSETLGRYRDLLHGTQTMALHP